MNVVADQLFDDIMTIEDELTQFCHFGDQLIRLPFPFIGKPPVSRFEMIDPPSAALEYAPGHFEYYGREAFAKIYNDIKALNYWRGYSMYYLSGTLGYGKSYILAAVACLLIRQGFKVVYLPDCRGLVRAFCGYLRAALLLTFAGKRALQEEILACSDDKTLVGWCTNIKDKLYFIVDQINALDTCEEALDSVSKRSREKCSNYIAVLEQAHYLIFSSSGNYHHGIRESVKQSGVKREVLFGGLSEVGAFQGPGVVNAV